VAIIFDMQTINCSFVSDKIGIKSVSEHHHQSRSDPAALSHRIDSESCTFNLSDRLWLSLSLEFHFNDLAWGYEHWF